MSFPGVMGTLGAWVHNLKPELFEISDKFALRWYGLAYLVGFVAGYFGLRWLAQKPWKQMNTIVRTRTSLLSRHEVLGMR